MLTFCTFSGGKLSRMSTSTSHESKFGGEISSVINCVNLTSSDSDGM